MTYATQLMWERKIKKRNNERENKGTQEMEGKEGNEKDTDNDR